MDNLRNSVADGELAEAIASTEEILHQRGLSHPLAIMYLDELANLHETVYVKTKDLHHLQESIVHRVNAVGMPTSEEFYRCILLNSASRVFMRLFDHSKDQSALSKAEIYARQALSMYPCKYANRCMSLQNLAIILHARFEQHGSFENLEESIAFAREALAMSRNDSHERASLTCTLAFTTESFFEKTREISDLDISIDFHREALTMVNMDDPRRNVLLSRLHTLSECRYERSRQEDLETWRNNYSPHPLGRLEYAFMMSRLEVSAWIQTDPGKLTDKGEALVASLMPSGQIAKEGQPEQLITLLRAVLAFLPRKHAYTPFLLHSLASSIANRFLGLQRIKDLEESILLNRDALSLFSDRNPIRAQLLNNLGILLILQNKQSGKVGDLEEAVMHMREALVITDDPSIRFMCTDRLSSTLRKLFEITGRKEYAEESIKLGRKATSMIDPGEKVDHFASLSSCACDLFQKTNDTEHIDEAIDLTRMAISACPKGHSRRVGLLSNLSSFLTLRYEQTQKEGDVLESIQVAQESCTLALHFGDTDVHAGALINLGNALLYRASKTSQVEHIEEAIRVNRMATSTIHVDHESYHAPLSNLANALRFLFKQNGRIEDLNEAIAVHYDALGHIRPFHSQRERVLRTLGESLLSRFEREGKAEDLEAAIRFFDDALPLCPEGSEVRCEALSGSARCLLLRFLSFGHFEDLRRSIVLFMRVLKTSRGSTELGNLACSLYLRFEHTGERECLEKAIQFQRAALSSDPEDVNSRSHLLKNLAEFLSDRFVLDKQSEDLQESIRLRRAALDHRPKGHPGRYEIVAQLGSSMFQLFGCDGRSEDLEEAIRLSRSALELCPEGHVDRTLILVDLAKFSMSRFDALGRTTDLEYAMQMYRHAATYPFSALLTQLRVACQWAENARHRKHQSASGAYNTALLLLQRFLTINPTLQTQHTSLASQDRFTEVVREAASYAVETGHLERAVEILEQGRALLWSQMRGLRVQIDRIKQVDKNLADRFVEVSCQLERLATTESRKLPLSMTSTGTTYNDYDKMLATKRCLSEEQETLITRIKQMRGLEDFLSVTPFETLNEAAEDGPVVVLIHSKYRCDAIILLRGSPPTLVPLDHDFYKDSCEFFTILTTTRVDLQAGSPGYNLILGQVMQMLWDRVVCRVVEKLKELGVQVGARIWWCPTGILSAFPFHAAGPYTSDNRKKYLMDDYVSSYTPTLKALIASRHGISKQKPKLLIVGDTSLPSAEEEIQAIERYGFRPLSLIDHDAVHDVVVKALQEHTWAHLTCHGGLGLEPFDSSFKLSDRRLTLLDIARANIPNAEFAFLSACHSADSTNNFRAPDEVLHLAAGMNFCGFRSVIGTMWELLDEDGPGVAKDVYAVLSKKQKGEFRFKMSAAALRAAVLKLKERLGPQGADASLERWVNFVHIGA